MRSVLASFVVVSVGLVTSHEFTGLYPDPFCQAGEILNLHCETCKCIYPGKWSCIDKFPEKWSCLNFRNKRDVPVPSDLGSTPCSPNDFFVIDCNRCYCNVDRTGYVCTEKLCPLKPAETDGKRTAVAERTPDNNVVNMTSGVDVPLNGVDDRNDRSQGVSFN